MQHREHDGQVALEVLLLVDREQDLAALDARVTAGLTSKVPTLVPAGATCWAGTVTSGSRPRRASVPLLAAK